MVRFQTTSHMSTRSTRHGRCAHDMVVTHDMIRPCRGVHMTMSCRTCTHDMVTSHTTWSDMTMSCGTFHMFHTTWSICTHDVPHDMVSHHTTWSRSTRHHHTTWGMSCGTSDHVVCAPCRVYRLTMSCGVLGLPM